MGCPYTATKNFFANALEIFFPRQGEKPSPEKEAIQEEGAVAVPDKALLRAGLLTMHSLSQISSALTVKLVGENSGSTVRGNRPVKKADLDDQIFAEAHWGLRNTVGKVADVLDKDLLPQTIKAHIADLDAQIAAHDKQVQPLKKMHRKLIPVPHDTDRHIYSNLKELEDQIMMAAPMEQGNFTAIRNAEIAIYEIDKKTEATLAALDDEFAKQDTLYLRGHDQPVPQDKHQWNAMLWMFYAGYASKTIFDTTRIPKAFSTRLRNALGEDAGIIPGLWTNLAAQPALMQKPLVKTLDHAHKNIQNRLVNCGSYEDLKRVDREEVLTCAGIVNKDIYEEIKKRITEKDAEPAPVSSGAKCPLGYGPR